MSAVEIVIDSGFDVVNDALQGLVDFGENPFEFLDEVGGQLVTNTQIRFDEGVGPDGSRWKVSKRAEREGGKTLKDDGNLVDSITHNATADYVDVGTNSVYGAIHQLGGETGSRNGRFVMDQREYLGINDEDQKMIQDTAFDFLEAAARG